MQCLAREDAAHVEPRQADDARRGQGGEPAALEQLARDELADQAGRDALLAGGEDAPLCVLAATRLFGEEELGLLRRAAAAWTVATAAPLALPTRYQGDKLRRHLRRLDVDDTWSLCIRLADLLECRSLQLTFSDDRSLPPRIHRTKDAAVNRRTPGRLDSESSVAVTLGEPNGLQCDLCVSYIHSGNRNAFHAACLAEVVQAFAERFHKLALADALPVLHILSDDREEVVKPRRAA
jgi:hypothetical protein